MRPNCYVFLNTQGAKIYVFLASVILRIIIHLQKKNLVPVNLHKCFKLISSALEWSRRSGCTIYHAITSRDIKISGQHSHGSQGACDRNECMIDLFIYIFTYILFSNSITVLQCTGSNNLQNCAYSTTNA